MVDEIFSTPVGVTSMICTILHGFQFINRTDATPGFLQLLYCLCRILRLLLVISPLIILLERFELVDVLFRPSALELVGEVQSTQLYSDSLPVFSHRGMVFRGMDQDIQQVLFGKFYLFTHPQHLLAFFQCH